MIALITPAPASAEAVAEGFTLRVLTYNIHHGEGTDGVVDLDRIADVIRAATPDVVCLQEVDRNQARSGRVDQAKVLAEALEMGYVFESNYDFGGGGYGNATLGRFPILEHDNLQLPNPHDVEPRGALWTRIDADGQQVSVINTHFGLKADERAAQAEAVFSIDRGGTPAILAGDLNEDETAGGVALLLSRYESAHGALAEGNQFTSPATNPRRRIDFVLFTEPFRVVSADIVHSELTKTASDHLPVIAELFIPKGAGEHPGPAKE